MGQEYRIEYAPEARRHLREFSKRDQAIILDRVDQQLTHQPQLETRHRKPLKPNLIAAWELRVGQFRVYYVVRDEPEREVRVRAIGVKEHNVVRIGGEVASI